MKKVAVVFLVSSALVLSIVLAADARGARGHSGVRSRVVIGVGPAFWWGWGPYPYWYYCPSARTYYPMVQTCPEPWVKVLPRP